PDLDSLARRHPDLADELRSLWATLYVAEVLARDDHGEPPAGGGPDDGEGELALATARWPISTEDSKAAPSSFSDDPASFGYFPILEELGRGGMGVVYRVREPGRDRVVALKRMLRGTDSSMRDVERFRVEAMAASHLAHPHIVPVFQVGELEGQPF